MKTVAEIESSLLEMPTKDLHHIEATIHQIYRNRNERVIYDDAYGVWLAEDQTSVAAEVFGLLEQHEEEAGDAEAR
jgi:hypothetical protein